MPQVLLVNPARRRRKRKSKARRNPVSNPFKRRRRRRSSFAGVGRKRRRFRSNPIARGIVNSEVMPALAGAGGAIAADLALAFLPLPANLKTGIARPAVQGAVAIGLGMLAGNFLSRQTGAQVAIGGLTIALYSFVKPLLQNAMPTLPLSAVDDYPVIEYHDADQMSALMQYDGMGDLVDESSIDGMGVVIDGMGELVDETSY